MYDNTSPQKNILAATFKNVEDARETAKSLKDSGFGGIWIGLAQAHSDDSVGSTGTDGRVEAENWFQRVFGEGNESLHDALVRHGVSESEASAAGGVGQYGAVLTVDGENHPEEAAQIMSTRGGQLISQGYGASGYGTTGQHQLYDVGSAEQATSKDYGRYRGGETLDDTRRIQLREERLRIGRERVSAGSAQVGKRVVETTQEIDVPVAHEELFISRRPVTSGPITGAIGEGEEVITVPLSAEHVELTKETFVTEEVEVGKRSVDETRHLSDTTRKEVLEVGKSGEQNPPPAQN